MKKRILSLALALILVIAFVPAALAAEDPGEWTAEWLGATFTQDIITPHEYLGMVNIGNLYDWRGDLSTWNYDVFIVEDSVSSFTLNMYTTKRTKEFHTYVDGYSFSDLHYSEEYDYVIVTQTLDGDQNGARGTKNDPFVCTYFKTEGRWLPQGICFNLYAGEDSNGLDYYEDEVEFLGWVGYGAIVLTKSELAEFKKTGQLPPLDTYSGDIDLYSYMDLTELKNLLSGKASEEKPSTPEPTPTPTPAPTPAPTTPVSGDTAKLKTTDALVSVVPPSPAEGKDLAYTVQKGEALWSIAWNYYGSMSKTTVNKIYNANAAYFKKTKGVLEAGAVITLPAKGLKVPVTQSSLDKAAGMYLVKAGDTLGAIAKKYYGDSKQWKKLLEANKDRVKVVGGSPMIYEGQWLVIPE